MGARGELLEQRPDPGRLGSDNRSGVFVLDQEEARNLDARLIDRSALGGENGVESVES